MDEENEPIVALGIAAIILIISFIAHKYQQTEKVYAEHGYIKQQGVWVKP